MKNESNLLLKIFIFIVTLIGLAKFQYSNMNNIAQDVGDYVKYERQNSLPYIDVKGYESILTDLKLKEETSLVENKTYLTVVYEQTILNFDRQYNSNKLENTIIDTLCSSKTTYRFLNEDVLFKYTINATLDGDLLNLIDTTISKEAC